MKSSERLSAFIGAMLITFGITALDMEQLDFNHNSKAYIAMIGGLLLLAIFFISRYRNKTQ